MQKREVSLSKKIKVMKLYINEVGVKSIEGSEGISTPLIIYWIRNFCRMLKS